MPRDPDVLVIGAGPAGSVAAMILAAAGRSVSLVEKEHMPRYKTCGGAVVGRALADLPCPPPTERDIPLHRESRLSLHHDGRPPIVVERPDAPITLVMRADFDAYLARRAEEAGAVRLEGIPFRGLRPDGDGYVCRIGDREIRARAVVGADGAESRVARSIAPDDSTPLGVALEGELATGDRRARDPLHREIRFDLGVPRDGYAWVFPKSAGLSVGVFSRRPRHPDLRRDYGRYRNALDLDGPEAKQDRLSGHRIPVRPRRRPGRGAVLLAGDAAGLADPLTGEGISYAIRSGRLAAEAILGAGGELAGASRDYRRRLGPLRSELRAAAFLAALIYRLPGPGFGLLGRHPAFADAVVDVFLGRRTYGELLGRALRRPWKLL